MTQQNPQLGGLVHQSPRLRRPLPVGTRIDADDLDATTAKLDRLALVDEQASRSELGQPRGARERITAVLDVVIAEYDEGRLEATEQLAQDLLTPRSRDEVASNEDEL